MREGIKKTARGHEGLTVGDGEIEKRGGSVLLLERTGGVKSFGEVRNGAGVGDERSAIGVVLGDEPELAKRLRSRLLGNGAELGDQRSNRAALHFHSWTAAAAVAGDRNSKTGTNEE